MSIETIHSNFNQWLTKTQVQITLNKCKDIITDIEVINSLNIIGFHISKRSIKSRVRLYDYMKYTNLEVSQAATTIYNVFDRLISINVNFYEIDAIKNGWIPPTNWIERHREFITDTDLINMAVNNDKLHKQNIKSEIITKINSLELEISSDLVDEIIKTISND
jgi:hypothetical protein